MKIITIPEMGDGPAPYIYLSGDSQSSMLAYLKSTQSHLEFTVFCPGSVVDADENNALIQQHTKSEYRALRGADLVVFWLGQGSLRAMTLLELGMQIQRYNTSPGYDILIGAEGRYNDLPWLNAWLSESISPSTEAITDIRDIHEGMAKWLKLYAKPM